MRRVSVIAVLLCSLILCQHAIASAFTTEELQEVIHRAVDNAHNLIKDPVVTASYLGTYLSSQWFVFSHYTGHHDRSKIDAAGLRDVILSQQKPDGSWIPVHDASIFTGTPEATVWNYFALKVIGEDVNSPSMTAARNWLLAKGGLDSLNAMNRLFLAITGNYDYSFFRSIPLWVFNRDGLFGSLTFLLDYVSQWVASHLTPIAYVINHKPVMKLPGPQFDLSELIVPGTQTFKFVEDCESTVFPSNGQYETPDHTHMVYLAELLSHQQPRGSFGAYTLATMLTIFVMQDWSRRFGPREEFVARIERGFQFIDELYSLPGYQGSPDWGMWWDHALLGIALRDGGASVERVTPFADDVVAAQQPNGGLPFGWDFEYIPDTDDTAETIIFWSKMGPKYRYNIERAVGWLLVMQNTDGGWSAFHRGHTGDGPIGWIINKMASQFANSAQIFDPSEPDVTSHILEAMALIGYTADHPQVSKAIQFLKNKQLSNGMWFGRWAINYGYATGTVLVAMSRMKQDLNEPWLVKAANWLAEHQNEDGGWGETSASYDNISLAGVGVSTPSQTAWAIMGIMEAERAGQKHLMPAINRGIAYLLQSFQQNGRWVDPSCVGTGHPKLIYMQYPVYSPAFTLTAVARYHKYYVGDVPALQ